ncbi:MAG: NADH-quinone oxidoreductase subunit H [Candidatus Stygibacter frigidus]|nr:NADH-quinone oxidoreductase subunit H [Candidatus Stygibacter frigidus]
MDGLIIKIIYAFISLSVATIWGLLLGGIAMKVVARAHGRFGPPVWQPIVDIIKNNARRTSISHGIMYFLGPVFRIAGGMGTFLFIPFIFGSTLFGNFSFAGDLFLVMYFIFFGQLGMALGAGESGHPYSAIGVARGLSQMTAFELPFALSIISLVIQYGTLNITDIVTAQQGGILNWTLITNPLATIAALISLQGMNMHNPFSIVIAPQEIPIGPPTEYHSNFLGLLQTNRGLFNIAKLALFMNLYFGGATNLAIMILKTFLIYMITVIIGAAFPRFRTEQSIRFFLGVPTILGILAVIIVAYL